MVVATRLAKSSVTSEAIQAFVATMRGPVVQPNDPDYDEVRSLYNGMIDKRPRLIARCVDVADVIAAVNFWSGQRRARRHSRRRSQWPGPWQL